MLHLTAGPADHAARLSILAAIAAIMLGASSASALEEKSNEKSLLKSCEARLCTMLLQKNPKGEDLNCELTKTWARSVIKKADQPTMQWGYGDARCTVKIHIPRDTIVKAVTAPEFSFQVASHTAECVVEENGEPQTVKATLSPKIIFKNGKAEKVWVNLEKIKGPVGIKASLWLAANLSDKVGIFHRPMIKGINKFISKHCPKTYPNALRATAPQAHERTIASKRSSTARPAADKGHGG